MSLNLAIATSSTTARTSGSQSSSKFRGVTQQRSGKWGAWISFNDKGHWLGTFDVEDEAARAYDRAAIKLQRSNASRNFPMSMYTNQEMRFQGQYSKEEILNMIKGKTYVTKFSEFLTDQSLAMGFNMVMSQSHRNGGVRYELLFRKQLTQTNVTKIRGFHISRECAAQHFPSLDGSNLGNGEEGERSSIELTFYDKHGRSWMFGYSFWKSTQTFVFTKGWKHFVRMNCLKLKDYVFFYRCEHQREDDRNKYYMIDVHRAGLESYRFMGHESEAEETASEVMLFGVPIGKGSGTNRRRRTNE